MGDNMKALLFSTGTMAKIDHKEVAEYFSHNYCQSYGSLQNEDYLKMILTNVFKLCGYKHFIPYFKNEVSNKISLSKVINKLQKKFNTQEWQFLKTVHKKSSRGSSMKSHSLKSSSAMSYEEDKASVRSHDSKKSKSSAN